MTERARIPRHRRAATQRGFTLLSAVFLMTLLMLLSAYLVGLSVRQESGFSLDVLGSRAFAAARAGVEWGAYQALRGGGCGGSASLALDGSLAGFTASVTSTAQTFSLPTNNEGGTTITVCSIASNACNQPSGGNCPNGTPGVNYVERQITSMVGK